jgi:hypothetical protein
MKFLLAKPDVYVRAHVLVAVALGAMGALAVPILLLGGLASIDQVVPLFSLSWMLLSALPWELRGTPFDARGRYARIAKRWLAISILLLGYGVWSLMRSRSP